MSLMATSERVRGDSQQGWPATIEDLEMLQDSGLRAELIDGDLIVTPPPNEWHQDVAYHLLVTLGPSLEGHGLTVRDNRGLRLTDNDMFIPDVVVYRTDRPARSGLFLAPADVVMAVEIVSHSSRRIDRLTKPAALAANGIPFYLLVDPFPAPVRLTLFELVADSYDQIAQVEAGTPLPLPAPFDITLDTTRLA